MKTKDESSDIKMASAANNIACPKCEIFLRPPFKTCRDGHLLCKNCRQHIDAVTEEAVAYAACGDNQFPMTVLNKLLKNPSDECQYGCGHHGNVVDLTDHEEACPLRCKCAVSSCSWLGGLSKLIKHVEGNHPDILVDIPAVQNNFTLGFEHPVLLLTRLNKASPNNDLYWLRLRRNEDNSQFVLMQYEGQLGQMVDKKVLINEYILSPVNYPKLPINIQVIFPKSNKDNIRNDKFVESQGTDVTVFNAKQFLIKIKDESPLASETLPEDFDCYICTEVMSGLCETCCEKINSACPKCRKKSNTVVRNNSLETLINDAVVSEGTLIKMEKEIPCWYVDSGCLFTSKAGVEGHVQECEYQPTQCMHEMPHNYRCCWEGSQKAFLNHVATSHRDYVKATTSEIKFSLFSNNYFYFVHDNNHFMLWIDKRVRTVSGLTQKYCNIFFSHLTTQASSNYNYGIRMTSNTNALPKIFGARCLPYGGCLEPLGEVVVNDSYALTMFVIISHRDV